jgi:hypothetical protein
MTALMLACRALRYPGFGGKSHVVVAENITDVIIKHPIAEPSRLLAAPHQAT